MSSPDALPPDRWATLAAWIAGQAGAARVDITDTGLLAGGAVQENWRLDIAIDGGALAGRHALVLRTDAPSSVAASHNRRHEYALLRAAWEAGVTVPEPLWACAEPDVFGRPFYLMRRLPGVALGPRVVRGDVGPPDALAERLGRELARIHAIRPPRDDLDFLTVPAPSPALAAVATYRGYLDALPAAYPAFEWGLRWLEVNAPEPGELVLLHRDYRTGNYLVENGELVGILDWEFAGWGDRHEDLAWLCAKCWRFGGNDWPAGGIGSRAAFYRGYEAASGVSVDRSVIPYWDLMASVRWGIIALQQGQRHLSGQEPSLDLALTGRRPLELAFDIVELIDRIEAQGEAAQGETA